MDIGWPEILIVLVIVLAVFGPGKLPEVGTALGKTIHSFRKAQDSDDTPKAPAVVSARPAVRAIPDSKDKID